MTDETQARLHWQSAYQWLCRQRMKAPPGADVWDVRFKWPAYQETWFRQVRAGRYRLAPMLVTRGQNGQPRLAMWSALDALVLKWVALQIADRLPVNTACHHLKGHGGVSGSTRAVAQAWHDPRWRFVFRTDIRGYYRHIIKRQVENQLAWWVPDNILRDLCHQWLYYAVEDGGEIGTPGQGITGIARGCALSPLIGGSLLRHLDGHFGLNKRIFYARYMDDFLFFTTTRWQLRRCVRELHDYFDTGGFQTHPDKTQTGKIEHGFDWSGLWYAPGGTRLADRAINNHRERRARLQEQARWRGLSEADTAERVRAYEHRWTLWAERLLALTDS